jgi:hypothetical protein
MCGWLKGGRRTRRCHIFSAAASHDPGAESHDPGSSLTIQEKRDPLLSLALQSHHPGTVTAIEGDSYRLKEARERSEQRARQRNAAKR